LEQRFRLTQEEEAKKRVGLDYHKILESREFLPKKDKYPEQDSEMGYYRVMAENHELVVKPKTCD